MKRTSEPVQARLDDLWLDLEQLCRLAGVQAAWVQRRMQDGLLGPRAVPPDAPKRDWRFDATTLRRARAMARLERDFDAVPELAALVLDLEEELATLRARLRRLGG